MVPFSIQSITEEFTDTALEIKHNHFVHDKPLDTVIKIKDQYIGKQELLIVRHPETYTFYHYYKSKGLKNVKFYAGFPDHSYEVIKTIIDLGLHSKREIPYKSIKIKPIEFLTEVLKYLPKPEGYEEKEDLWVSVSGRRNKKKYTVKMHCFVATIPGWEDAGSNVDTGMTISIIGQMIHQGVITEAGGYAPEAIVPPIPFFKALREKNMRILENKKLLL